MATSNVLVRKLLPAEGGKPALLRLSLWPMPRGPLEPEQVAVRVGGAPIHPSDLGGLLMGGDRLDEGTAYSNELGLPQVDVPLPEHIHIEHESDWSPVGNEGAGVVEEVGSKAQHLLGKTVFFQGATYTELTVRHMSEVQPQPEGVTAKQAAASFTNPMTVLGMLEKARREGHSALGGGNLASTIFECMEAAAWKRGDPGSHYGSSVWKQVYTYGRLELAPMEMSLNFGGYRWNLGGYLVTDFMDTVSEEWKAEARARIARELETTFRTDYTKEVSLRELLTIDNLKLTNSKGTGLKLLIVP